MDRETRKAVKFLTQNALPPVEVQSEVTVVNGQTMLASAHEVHPQHFYNESTCSSIANYTSHPEESTFVVNTSCIEDEGRRIEDINMTSQVSHGNKDLLLQSIEMADLSPSAYKSPQITENYSSCNSAHKSSQLADNSLIYDSTQPTGSSSLYHHQQYELEEAESRESEASDVRTTLSALNSVGNQPPLVYHTPLSVNNTVCVGKEPSVYQVPLSGGHSEYRGSQSSIYQEPLSGGQSEYRRSQSSIYQEPISGGQSEYRASQSSIYQEPISGGQSEYRGSQSSIYQEPISGGQSEYRGSQSSIYQEPISGSQTEFCGSQSEYRESPSFTFPSSLSVANPHDSLTSTSSINYDQFVVHDTTDNNNEIDQTATVRLDNGNDLTSSIRPGHDIEIMLDNGQTLGSGQVVQMYENDHEVHYFLGENTCFENQDVPYANTVTINSWPEENNTLGINSWPEENTFSNLVDYVTNDSQEVVYTSDHLCSVDDTSNVTSVQTSKRKKKKIGTRVTRNKKRSSYIPIKTNFRFVHPEDDCLICQEYICDCQTDSQSSLSSRDQFYYNKVTERLEKLEYEVGKVQIGVYALTTFERHSVRYVSLAELKYQDIFTTLSQVERHIRVCLDVSTESEQKLMVSKLTNMEMKYLRQKKRVSPCCRSYDLIALCVFRELCCVIRSSTNFPVEMKHLCSKLVDIKYYEKRLIKCDHDSENLDCFSSRNPTTGFSGRNLPASFSSGIPPTCFSRGNPPTSCIYWGKLFVADKEIAAFKEAKQIFISCSDLVRTSDKPYITSSTLTYWLTKLAIEPRIFQYPCTSDRSRSKHHDTRLKNQWLELTNLRCMCRAMFEQHLIVNHIINHIKDGLFKTVFDDAPTVVKPFDKFEKDANFSNQIIVLNCDSKQLLSPGQYIFKNRNHMHTFLMRKGLKTTENDSLIVVRSDDDSQAHQPSSDSKQIPVTDLQTTQITYSSTKQTKYSQQASLSTQTMSSPAPDLIHNHSTIPTQIMNSPVRLTHIPNHSTVPARIMDSPKVKTCSPEHSTMSSQIMDSPKMKTYSPEHSTMSSQIMDSLPLMAQDRSHVSCTLVMDPAAPKIDCAVTPAQTIGSPAWKTPQISEHPAVTNHISDCPLQTVLQCRHHTAATEISHSPIQTACNCRQKTLSTQMYDSSVQTTPRCKQATVSTQISGSVDGVYSPQSDSGIDNCTEVDYSFQRINEWKCDSEINKTYSKEHHSEVERQNLSPISVYCASQTDHMNDGVVIECIPVFSVKSPDRTSQSTSSNTRQKMVVANENKCARFVDSEQSNMNSNFNNSISTQESCVTKMPRQILGESVAAEIKSSTTIHTEHDRGRCVAKRKWEYVDILQKIACDVQIGQAEMSSGQFTLRSSFTGTLKDKFSNRPEDKEKFLKLLCILLAKLELMDKYGRLNELLTRERKYDQHMQYVRRQSRKMVLPSSHKLKQNHCKKFRNKIQPSKNQAEPYQRLCRRKLKARTCLCCNLTSPVKKKHGGNNIKKLHHTNPDSHFNSYVLQGDLNSQKDYMGADSCTTDNPSLHTTTDVTVSHTTDSVVSSQTAVGALKSQTTNIDDSNIIGGVPNLHTVGSVSSSNISDGVYCPHTADGVSCSDTTDGVSCPHTADGVSCSHTTDGVSCSHTADGISCSHTADGVSCSHTAGGVLCSQTTDDVSCSHTTDGVSCSHTTGGVSCSHTTDGVCGSHTTNGVSCSHTTDGVGGSHTTNGVSCSQTMDGVSCSHTTGGVSCTHSTDGVSCSHTTDCVSRSLTTNDACNSHTTDLSSSSLTTDGAINPHATDGAINLHATDGAINPHTTDCVKYQRNSNAHSKDSIVEDIDIPISSGTCIEEKSFEIHTGDNRNSSFKVPLYFIKSQSFKVSTGDSKIGDSALTIKRPKRGRPTKQVKVLPEVTTDCENVASSSTVDEIPVTKETSSKELSKPKKRKRKTRCVQNLQETGDQLNNSPSVDHNSSTTVDEFPVIKETSSKELSKPKKRKRKTQCVQKLQETGDSVDQNSSSKVDEFPVIKKTSSKELSKPKKGKRETQCVQKLQETGDQLNNNPSIQQNSLSKVTNTKRRR